MSFAKRHEHKGPLFTYRLPEGEVTYLKLKDLDRNKVYEVRGFYINTSSQFHEEDAAMIMTDAVLNLPQHLLRDVKEIMADPDDVNDINGGVVGFRVVEKQSDKGKYLSVEWVDL